MTKKMLHWLIENKAVIVVDSQEKFEQLEHSEVFGIDDINLMDRGFETTKINGIPVVFIEGGVVKLYDTYLKLLQEKKG